MKPETENAYKIDSDTKIVQSEVEHNRTRGVVASE